MSYYEINTAGARGHQNAMGGYERKLKSNLITVQSASSSLGMRIKQSENIKARLKACIENLQNGDASLRSLEEILGETLRLYKDAEKYGKDSAGRLKTSIDGNSIYDRLKEFIAFVTSQHIFEVGILGPGFSSLLTAGWNLIETEPGKFKYSLLGAQSEIETSILGIGVGAAAAAGLYNISGELKPEMEWKVSEGEAKIGVSAGLDASLVSANVEGNVGYLSAGAEVNVGHAAGTGAIGATLFTGGVLTPALYAGVEGKASAVDGKVSAQFGTDDFNRHAEAKGALLTAEGKAGFQAGVITDENGDKKYGVKTEVGAEAYLAKGEVTGGFTLFGIKIDGTIEGKAGGAGVKAGGEVSTGAVEGELGLGLGLGVGVKFKVDFSGFKLWPWS